MRRPKQFFSDILFLMILIMFILSLTILVSAGSGNDESTYLTHIGDPTPTPTTLMYLPYIRYDFTLTPTATPTPSPTSIPAHVIYMGSTLAPGYDLGVNSSGELTNWVTDMNDHICMAYPPGQSWGAVFITFGPPTDPPRPGQDLSAYNTLSLELRGAQGGEDVKIGLKDNTDFDDGRETKFRASDQQPITTTWQTYTWSLEDFVTADLSRLYVVTEFVFDWPGTVVETVCFRNIKYLP